MRTFTPDELDEIRRSYRNCLDPEMQVEILADLNVCNVQDIQRALGLPETQEKRRVYRSRASVRQRWSQADEQTLISKYMQGATYQQIADAVGRSRVAVINHTRLLRAQGLLPKEKKRRGRR